MTVIKAGKIISSGNGGAGMRIEGFGHNIEFEEGTFVGNAQGGLEIVVPQSLKEKPWYPRDLSESEVYQTLSEVHRLSQFDPIKAERIIEGSPLGKHLKAHGYDIANIALQILALMTGRS